MTGTALRVSCFTPICSIWCIKVTIARLKAETTQGSPSTFTLSTRALKIPLSSFFNTADGRSIANSRERFSGHEVRC
ncbi:hypothetical protein K443DRAFT_673108 [Laccaria amethystina LaAM-08-1]|uniref:Uncharacterized protein n=1 Tax=Laccaria amethystina LaAM-08-1 TaxID=1095629 RepID=A0A0C9XS98_9AGAR|nr:hypothetical protein K443DRAFT_673108 [Laccaria amethystina LaAM-08-1]